MGSRDLVPRPCSETPVSIGIFWPIGHAAHAAPGFAQQESGLVKSAFSSTIFFTGEDSSFARFAPGSVGFSC